MYLAIDANSIAVARKRATLDETARSIARIRVGIGRNTPNIDEIRSRMDETSKKLEAAKGGDERFVHSLQDNLAAQQLRFDNYGRAKQNAEFVRLELDRIEAKIQVLAESTVNQQDPNFLTSQIEGVT